MKILALFTGGIFGIAGVFAFAASSEMFLKYGWFLGVLLALSGMEMFLPAKRKFQGGISKYVYGGLSVLFGVMFVIGGLKQTLIDMIIAYFIGACVVLCGMYLVSMGRKEPKKMETYTHTPKKSRKTRQEIAAQAKKKDDKLVSTVAGAVAIVAGGILICKPFLADFPILILVGINLIALGAAWIVMALNIE